MSEPTVPVWGFRELQEAPQGPGLPLGLIVKTWSAKCDDRGRICGRDLVFAVAVGLDGETDRLKFAPALAAYGQKVFNGGAPIFMSADGVEVAEHCEMVFAF